MITGVDRDDELLSELASARGFRRVEIAADLGDSQGVAGADHLRLLVHESGPGTSDLRCAALLALAKRCRDDAHDDQVAAFRSRDAGTRSYAVLALAAFGRDGLWEEVADRLVTTMKRCGRRGSEPSDVVLMTVYLARHAGDDPHRLSTLVGILRKHWAGVDTRDSDEAKRWIDTYWPDAAPSGLPLHELPAPETASMERWIRRHPLLADRA